MSRAAGWRQWIAWHQLLVPAGEADFRVGQLRLRFDLRMAQPFPSGIARRGWLPFEVRVRLGGINAEDVFDAARGEFSEGDFAGFAQFFGAGEGLVGQLNLSSRHADRLTAHRNAVNAAAARFAFCFRAETTVPLASKTGQSTGQ